MGETIVGSLKSIAQGYLAATALIMSLNIASLMKSGDTWLALLYLLISLIPAGSLIYLKFANKNSTAHPLPDEKWRNLLFSFQGVALAFWTFDLTTTFYAINVTGLAVELNPLGWPLGILGALAYYGPTIIGSYMLLFKIKDRIAFYAAIPLTLVTLGMSAQNLMAGNQNFQVFVDTTALATGVRYSLLALIAVVGLTIPFALKKVNTQPKAVLS
jgi:hypothetical protein